MADSRWILLLNREGNVCATMVGRLQLSAAFVSRGIGVPHSHTNIPPPQKTEKAMKVILKAGAAGAQLRVHT